MNILFLRYLLILFILWTSPSLYAAGFKIGLLEHYSEGASYTNEWAWALRGGGAKFNVFAYHDLASLDSQTPLLIIDNAPLDDAAGHALERWVHQGGLLIYAGAYAALQVVNEHGEVHQARSFGLSALLGASFSGFEPGLIGTYPDIVTSTTLLSPLMPGDALRLGKNGVGHAVRVEATDAEILARSTRISPGQDGMVMKSTAPTILSKRHGQGRVVFLTFSPGQIARCYPDNSDDQKTLDCTGASQAHALMRWLTANLLWEERQLQLPLLWEAPGDRPHAVIITGDVHNNPFEVKAATKMGQLFDELQLPLSLYIIGQIAEDYPDEIAALHALQDLEISPHSANGKTYWTKRFKLSGKFGILLDLRKAETLLGVPEYPDKREWLISVRNESWQSDRGAWWAMEREGVGLVFDYTADSIKNRSLYLAPHMWFAGGERQKIFVPLFERSVATPVDNFRLQGDSAQNIALLASAQAEPCCIPLSYHDYTHYVHRWHALFDRLSIMGGLSEVWLWHPGGIALKRGFTKMVKTMQLMKNEPRVSILRGDVIATWRYNREIHQIQVHRDADAAIKNIKLIPPFKAIKPLPEGAPDFAASTSYWVLGDLTVPGWKSHNWVDEIGRTITVLVHPLGDSASDG